MCPNLKNYNNEHLPFDQSEVRSSIGPEWTRQARMELCFAMNGLYFCFMLDRCLYFSISALQLTSGRKLHWPLSQCHTSCNVTNYQLWRGRGQIPLARTDQ